MKLFFVLFLIYIIKPSNIWSDDIWFTLPSQGQPISGIMEIKIYPPPSHLPVHVWIENDKTEDVVWIGELLPEQNYSITVDTTKFIPGKYEIKALYYLYGKEYDGDIDIWVNSP